jgi:collagen type VI alpha
MVFILDSSGSVEMKFDMAMQLTRKIVHGLNFAGGRTRVGVMTYGDSPTIRFHLNQYTDKQSVMNAIAFTQQLGRTNTAGAIDQMRLDMFTSNRGDRPGDPNYAILITDGYSNINQHRTIPAADQARQRGIKMVAVGIGENGSVDRGEINGIANDPDNQFAYLLRNENDMDRVANGILDIICQ